IEHAVDAGTVRQPAQQRVGVERPAALAGRPLLGRRVLTRRPYVPFRIVRFFDHRQTFSHAVGPLRGSAILSRSAAAPRGIAVTNAFEPLSRPYGESPLRRIRACRRASRPGSNAPCARRPAPTSRPAAAPASTLGSARDRT